MDNALAKTKQAVSRYKSRSQSDSLNATKSVWAAVRFLRKQLPELERKEKGVTTRVARELNDVLGKLPMFRHIKEDKEATESLQTKPEAEEHILKLENQLKAMVKDLENSKIDEIKSWVENHSVLGALTKTLTRKMPDSTYIFLFRQLKNNNIELVTSRAPDGRVFTRFRPREFFDVKKLYRLYNHRPPVGAAVVVDNKLQDVIGTVPQAKDNEDQLHVISTMSKEAASQPAKSFLSGNRVLQSLHELAKDRKVDKGAYILLFVDAEEQIDFDADDEELLASEDAGGDEGSHEPTADDDVSADDAAASADEPVGDQAASSEDAPAADVGGAVEQGLAADAILGSDATPAVDEVPDTEQAASDVPAAPPNEVVAEPTATSETVVDSSENTGELPAASNESGSTETPAATDESAAAETPAAETPAGETPASTNESTTAETPASTTDSITLDTPADAPSSSDESSEPAAQDAGGDQSAARQSDAGEIGTIANAEQESPSSSDTTGDAPSEQPSGGEEPQHGEAQQPAEAEQAPAEPEAEQVYSPVEILTRPGSDGGVLTRFYANEFSDVRKVFESFAGKRTISGAAVIRGRELIQVVGNVPQSAEGRSQLDILITESNHAADKPTRDFMVENEILNSLHELASGHFSDPNARVLVFSEEEGRLSVLTPPASPQREERGRDNRNRGGRPDPAGGARGRDDRGRNGRSPDDRGRGRDDDRPRENSGPAKSSPLVDFRYPRDIRNGYRNLARVVGASVIGEQKAHAPVRKEVKRDDNRGGGGGGRDQRFNDRTPRASKSVVLAAFGRTPLKENVLITEETMRRLGLEFFS
ncbi:MAG: hypothetical protein SGJ27_14615 [Candidatus Melainabacteria bacterium]|nr:hypothetical protein [Candidatus Melainabacteria bacterium]